MCKDYNENEETSIIPNEVKEARKKYRSITIHCPNLEPETLRPFPELNYGQKCPCNKDGKCGNCDKFIGYWSEDGTTFSFMSYEGFCDCKEENE